ncbi:MAG: glycosyltransferase family 2 protein [Elusimicrobiota bacterium]|nr:glycosyltransferase family 2 protein [Elusimicrobiota bacterium]
MENTPLVSVLIPAYNHEKYVQEAINSIISQTYKDIELLIVDDGSKDDTWTKICAMKEVCEKRFVRIDFSTQDNCGTCKTLNKLVDKAQGKYIYLIASDDLAKLHAIKIQSDFLENNPQYAQVMGDNEIIDGDSKRVFWDRKQKIVGEENAQFKTFSQFLFGGRKDVYFNSSDFGSYETLLKGNYIPNGNMWLREAFISIGQLTTEAPIEDWYINLQISKQYKIKYIDEILFSYRWHSANTAKDKQKMSRLIKQTINYELFLIRNDEKKLLFINNFVLYRKTSFLFFKVEKYRNMLQKKKYIVIFNKKFLIQTEEIYK